MNCLLSIALIFCLSLAGGCKKSEVHKGEEGDTPLIGTKWQLIGFADAKTGRIKKAENLFENTYTILFNEDGTFSGHTYSNSILGEAQIDIAKQKLHILEIGGTKINEFYDGRRFLECMRVIERFELGPQGLSLYYDSNNYLLFKPLIE